MTTQPLPGGGSGRKQGWSSLTAFLVDATTGSLELSFEQIEALMGEPLPPSARAHRPFWANTAKNAYSRHWMSAGFRTTTRDVPAGHIRFTRSDTAAFPPPSALNRQSDAAPTPLPSYAGAAEQSPDLILLGCVKRKRSDASAAKDLYASPLWIKRRRYAEASGVPWLILSAAHGVVDPETVLDPYDLALTNLDAAQRRAWAESVADDLGRRLDLSDTTIEIHAGMAYQQYLRPLLEGRGATVYYPLAGLTQGEQLRWYGESDDSTRQPTVTPAAVERTACRPTLGVGSVADQMIGQLLDPARRIPVRDVPQVDPTPFRSPGLYSWWVDDEGAAALGQSLGTEVGSLIYVGQAGATRWPSGERSSATLWSRLTTQHLGGLITTSTLRLTLTALLSDALDLSLSDDDLDGPSRERLNAFMADHLSVALVTFDDANQLDPVKTQVIEALDPSLNLRHVDRSVAHRRRITILRGDISARLGKANDDSASLEST